MHKRLLNITTQSYRQLHLSSKPYSSRMIHNLSVKTPRNYFMEPLKPNTNKETFNKNPFQQKEDQVELDTQNSNQTTKLDESKTRSTEAVDEREKIRKLRQQIKKREAEDFLGITTVTKKKSLLDHVKEGIASVKKSLKDLYKDAKYVYMLKKENGSWKNLKLVEYIKYKNINYDLIKFLPYSFFIVVPFAEFALPLYILLFPNSTPSQFYSEKTIGERTQKMILRQKEGAEVIKKKLYTTFGNDFIEIENKCKVLRENPEDKDAREKLLALDAKIMEKLKNEWQGTLSKQLGFYNLSIEEKEALLKVFYIEYISGVYIINQLYNLPLLTYNFISKYIKTQKVNVNEERWKLNFFPLLQLKIVSFRIQLLRHLQRIKKEDKLLNKNPNEQLNGCSSLELFELIRKRGFKIESDTDSKEFLSRYWSQHADIPNSDVRVWSVIIRHYYADYLI